MFKEGCYELDFPDKAYHPTFDVENPDEMITGGLKLLEHFAQGRFHCDYKLTGHKNPF